LCRGWHLLIPKNQKETERIPEGAKNSNISLRDETVSNQRSFVAHQCKILDVTSAIGSTNASLILYQKIFCFVNKKQKAVCFLLKSAKIVLK